MTNSQYSAEIQGKSTPHTLMFAFFFHITYT